MDAFEVLQNSLAIITPTVGGTGGLGLALFAWAIKNEKLWFAKQHDAIVAEKDKQLEQEQASHTRAIAEKDKQLELERASHEREVAQEKASHVREMGTVQAELERTREDRDTYKMAGEQDRQRADSVQGKMLDTVVPVLSGVDHALNELARQAAAREEAD